MKISARRQLHSKNFTSVINNKFVDYNTTIWSDAANRIGSLHNISDSILKSIPTFWNLAICIAKNSHNHSSLLLLHNYAHSIRVTPEACLDFIIDGFTVAILLTNLFHLTILFSIGIVGVTVVTVVFISFFSTAPPSARLAINSGQYTWLSNLTHTLCCKLRSFTVFAFIISPKFLVRNSIYF